MKNLILSLVLLFVTGTLFSQDWEVPKNYQLVKVEDYEPYEKDILECINWITGTPMGEQENKSKEANAFLLKWLMGSPYLHIEIKAEIVTFMNTSPDLLMIYLGGWAKHSLETRDFGNKVEGSLAGIHLVIDYYKKNKSVLKKDKNVEKYIKMKEKGKLTEFIEKNA